MKWPVWTGKVDQLRVWRLAMESKLANDRDILPDAPGVIYTIQAQLPQEQQSRTSDWITREAAKEAPTWDPLAFLDHVMTRCGDPQAAKVAERSLQTLRQGKFQPFQEFVQEFEILLSKAEGSGAACPDHIKISTMERALDLSDRLVGIVDQPDGYFAWVEFVRKVAARHEAHPQRMARAKVAPAYQLRSCQEASRGGGQPLPQNTSAAGGRSSQQQAPEVDQDGDIMMRVDQLVAASLQRQSNGQFRATRSSSNNKNNKNTNNDNRPRARWRTDAEMQRLRETRACHRCTQPGHAARPRSVAMPDVPACTSPDAPNSRYGRWRPGGG